MVEGSEGEELRREGPRYKGGLKGGGVETWWEGLRGVQLGFTLFIDCYVSLLWCPISMCMSLYSITASGKAFFSRPAGWYVCIWCRKCCHLHS